MDTSRLQPFTLRFKSEATEEAFIYDYSTKSLRQVRFALWLAIGFLGTYALWDIGIVSSDRARHQMWTVRAVSSLFVLSLILSSYTPVFRRNLQLFVGTGCLVVGVLYLGIMLLSRDAISIYAYGIVQVYLFICVLLRLRFISAFIVIVAVQIGFTVACIVFVDEWRSFFYINYTITTSVLVIGLFASYMLERNAREVFWSTKIIDEKRKENERLVAVQSRFFANISHEFRTPLTLILGPLDDFLHRTSDFAVSDLEQLQVMRRNGQRLLRLINQLLELSRIEAGNLQLQASCLDIIAFLRSLVFSFSSYADRKQIKLQFSASQDEQEIYFDAEKLEQVIINLLSNAFKFTAGGGKISVQVEVEEATARISVRDTGEGIPPEELPYIFDRFHQVDGSMQRRHEGSGIGLALVQELVHLHSGCIYVESELGFGSTFFVELPLGKEHLQPEQIIETAPGLPGQVEPLVPVSVSEEESATETSTEASSSSSEAETVLVVDDNADVRAYLRDCLLKGSLQVLEARDGQEGLEIARATVPDLIISDVMMPEMDGYEFGRQIKGDAVLKHIPVILLTAKASDESKIEGLKIGVDDYLYKPFNAKELLVRVRNLIALRKQLSAHFSRHLLVEPSDISVTSADDEFIATAREVVEAHMRETTFNVDGFAEEMGLSVRQLQRKLRAIMDTTPNKYLSVMRLKRAAQLLGQNWGTVSEVAYEVGFSDPAYFSRRFSEMYEQAPSEYALNENRG